MSQLHDKVYELLDNQKIKLSSVLLKERGNVRPIFIDKAN